MRNQRKKEVEARTSGSTSDGGRGSSRNSTLDRDRFSWIAGRRRSSGTTRRSNTHKLSGRAGNEDLDSARSSSQKHSGKADGDDAGNSLKQHSRKLISDTEQVSSGYERKSDGDDSAQNSPSASFEYERKKESSTPGASSSSKKPSHRASVSGALGNRLSVERTVTQPSMASSMASEQEDSSSPERNPTKSDRNTWKTDRSVDSGEADERMSTGRRQRGVGNGLQ